MRRVVIGLIVAAALAAAVPAMAGTVRPDFPIQCDWTTLWCFCYYGC